MTSLVAGISPNNSALALISIFSLALTLPVILPRTTTDCALMFPLTTAVSPRVSTPSVWISPSSLPSKVSSPENLRLPLISTSEPRTFFPGLVVLIFGSILVVVFSCRKQRRGSSMQLACQLSRCEDVSRKIFQTIPVLDGEKTIRQKSPLFAGYCLMAHDQKQNDLASRNSPN